MKPYRIETKKVLFIIAFTIILYVGLTHMNTILGTINYIIGLLIPFIIGGFIAFIVNLPMKRLEKRFFSNPKSKFAKKIKRPLCLTVSIVLILTVVLVVIILIVPELINTCAKMADNITNFMHHLDKTSKQLGNKYPQVRTFLSKIDFDWSQIGKNMITFASDTAANLVNSTFSIVSSIVSTVMLFFISFIFSIYLLYRKEDFIRQGKQVLYAYVPRKHAVRIEALCVLTNRTFSNFFAGQCVEALIQGVMFYIALSIFRFPFALMISVFIAFMSLIPIFGSYISSYTSAFLILTVNPIQAIAFLVLFAVLQQFEDNLIYPRVVGGSVGLPSIWVLISVTLGGSLMGIFGMLICIPLCSIFYTLFKRDVKGRLSKKEITITK